MYRVLDRFLEVYFFPVNKLEKKPSSSSSESSVIRFYQTDLIYVPMFSPIIASSADSLAFLMLGLIIVSQSEVT